MSTVTRARGDLDALRSRWMEEKARYETVPAMVPADRLIEEFLDDLNALSTPACVETVNLTEAAKRSGYTRQHISHLIKKGRLHNYGRHGAPRVRADELPRKPGHLPETTDPEHVSLTSRGQVVRSVLGRSSE